jgi:hypothetical protein
MHYIRNDLLEKGFNALEEYPEEDCFVALQSHSIQSKASGAFEAVGSNSFLKCKAFSVTYINAINNISYN